MNFAEVVIRSQRLIRRIRNCQNRLICALTLIETYKTASSEIEKSIHCLENIKIQKKYLANVAKGLCVFLPLNQPLYSLILFVVIPGFQFEEIHYRPPVLLKEVYMELQEILELRRYSIFCNVLSRRDFLNQFVIFANVVIYTGKYENALDVRGFVSEDTLFIYQGSATNPIIITKTASLTDEMVGKVVEAQTYNSGQDCMAPAAILVSDKAWDFFIRALEKRLSDLRVGDFKQKDTDIAQMIEQETVEKVKLLLQTSSAEIVYGGRIDEGERMIYPTILKFNDVFDIPYSSSFAPVFSVYRYSNEQDVEVFLSRPECRENRAYISIFGSLDMGVDDEVVISNDVLESIDDGFSEFGGYGVRSGFVAYKSKVIAKPILISKEIADYGVVCGFKRRS